MWQNDGENVVYKLTRDSLIAAFQIYFDRMTFSLAALSSTRCLP